MAKNKTPKGGYATHKELQEEIKEVWKQHKKRRKQNGMV
tara:strand:- start:11095 stop:11211 length:117 start_codon:yes stop_codon:yes gene_type:complete